jgi:membrane protease YdiL (CAAX protease family)
MEAFAEKSEGKGERNVKDRFEQLDVRTLRLHLYLTQGLVITAAAVASLLLHGWHGTVAVALLVAGVSIGMDRFLPRRWQDDGSVNERIFLGLSLPQTFCLCALIGIGEEWLFRGIVQPLAGNGWTSLVFTLVHFRYLRKPLLLVSVFGTSFLLGILFELHGRLLPPVMAHIAIDFILAVYLQRVREAPCGDPGVACQGRKSTGRATMLRHDEGRK